MPIFTFYKYTLCHVQKEEECAFAAEEEPGRTKLSKYATMEDCFGSFFERPCVLPMNVVKTSGKGKDITMRTDIYNNEVMASRNGVVLMTMDNNKVKHTIVHKKDECHEHHPFCHIIIDNRPGRQLMAVERSSSFDGKPDKVGKIFEKGMNEKMRPYGICLQLTAEQRREGNFMTVVEEMKTKFNDSVCSVRIDILGEEDKGNKCSSEDILGHIIRTAIVNSNNAALLLYKDGEEMELKEMYDQLDYIAMMCVKRKSYALTVKFRKFGLFTYGREIKAQFGVDKDVLEQFEHGEKEMNYQDENGCFALTKWLDRIYELLNDYEDEAPVEKRNKASHRR